MIIITEVIIRWKKQREIYLGWIYATFRKKHLKIIDLKFRKLPHLLEYPCRIIKLLDLLLLLINQVLNKLMIGSLQNQEKVSVWAGIENMWVLDKRKLLKLLKDKIIGCIELFRNVIPLLTGEHCLSILLDIKLIPKDWQSSKQILCLIKRY